MVASKQEPVRFAKSVALAVIAASLLVVGGDPADASCAAGGEGLESADAAFVGVALQGQVTPTGELFSPAHFRVVRWLKGNGPDEVRVPTAVIQRGDAIESVSVGINPSPGERWLIMLRGGSPACTGSRALREGERVPSPSADRWPLLPAALIVFPCLVVAVWLLRRRRQGDGQRQPPDPD